jgi:DNA-binding CsgD family transcriptional regulator/PAS domain-containing protein
MTAETEILELVAGIYDATLDDDGWTSVLGRISKFFNCANVSLGSFELKGGTTNLTTPWGFKSNYLAAFRERYKKRSPLVARAHCAPVGSPTSIRDVMSYEEFQQTSFYREWTQPQGHVDAVQVNLAKSATSVTFFIGGRDKYAGMVDEELRQRMRVLAPHLRRAVLIRQTIDRPQVEAAPLADAVDGLATPIVFVDADARIIYANPRGQALLNRKTILSSAQGKLLAKEPRADRLLRNVFVAAGGGDSAVNVKGIAVPLTSTDGERFVAHVLPLTAGARRKIGAAYAAVAAIFLRRIALDLPDSIAAIADSYQLTPAQRRVLMAIINVGGGPEAASMLGISETTAKTHLHEVFRKTGTNRQADLVKLVAGFLAP